MKTEDNKSGESGFTDQQPGNDGTALAENGGAPKVDQKKPGEDNQAKPNENGEQQGEGATVGKPNGEQQKKRNTVREKTILEIMDANKASELWENKSGEFFTSENLALLSEKGEKKHVKKHSRELIEARIDNA